MFLEYLGYTKNFSRKGIDFSKGPTEVPDALGKEFLARSPNTFRKVESPKPVSPVSSAEPAAKSTTAKSTTAKSTTAKSTTAKSTAAKSTTAKSTAAKSITAK